MSENEKPTDPWEVAEIIAKELSDAPWFRKLVMRDMRYIEKEGFNQWLNYASIKDKYPERLKDATFTRDEVDWDEINDKLASLLVDIYEEHIHD